MSKKRDREVPGFPELFVNAMICDDDDAAMVALSNIDMDERFDFEIPRIPKFEHLFKGSSQKFCISGATALIAATLCNNLEIIKKIISGGRADIDAEAKISDEYDLLISRGATPASFAIANGNKEAVLLLGAAGADFDKGGLFSNSPLVAATIIDRFDLMAIMIASGVNINADGRKGGPLYYAAIVNKNPEIMQLLLLKNCNPNATFIDDFEEKFKVIDELSLHYLELGDRETLVRMVILFSFGANISEEMRNKYLSEDFKIEPKNLELLRVIARFSEAFEGVDIVDPIKKGIINEATNLRRKDYVDLSEKGFIEAFGGSKKEEDLSESELLLRFMALKRFEKGANLEDVVKFFNARTGIVDDELRDKEICDDIDILFLKDDEKLVTNSNFTIEKAIASVEYLSSDNTTKTLLEMMGIYEESIELMQHICHNREHARPKTSVAAENSLVSITVSSNPHWKSGRVA